MRGLGRQVVWVSRLALRRRYLWHAAHRASASARLALRGSIRGNRPDGGAVTKRSTEAILATHTGSLARPPALLEAVQQLTTGPRATRSGSKWPPWRTAQDSPQQSSGRPPSHPSAEAAVLWGVSRPPGTRRVGMLSAAWH